mmetsp:Transcript_42844/g.93475  ORF Transcript_42844/g.93475 Transcript_42844/m.93475 type:complete len:219 (+) Transcript_42844:1038-1694(+)
MLPLDFLRKTGAPTRITSSLRLRPIEPGRPTEASGEGEVASSWRRSTKFVSKGSRSHSKAPVSSCQMTTKGKRAQTTKSFRRGCGSRSSPSPVMELLCRLWRCNVTEIFWLRASISLCKSTLVCKCWARALSGSSSGSLDLGRREGSFVKTPPCALARLGRPSFCQAACFLSEGRRCVLMRNEGKAPLRGRGEGKLPPPLSPLPVRSASSKKASRDLR